MAGPGGPLGRVLEKPKPKARCSSTSHNDPYQHRTLHRSPPFAPRLGVQCALLHRGRLEGSKSKRGPVYTYRLLTHIPVARGATLSCANPSEGAGGVVHQETLGVPAKGSAFGPAASYPSPVKTFTGAVLRTAPNPFYTRTTCDTHTAHLGQRTHHSTQLGVGPHHRGPSHGIL